MSRLRSGHVRVALLDAAAWVIAILVAALLRLDFHLAGLRAIHIAAVLPAVIAVQWVLGYVLGLYHGRWVRGSFDEVLALGRTVIAVTVVLLLGDLLAGQHPIPLSVVVGGAVLAFVMMGGVRSLRRLRLDRQNRQGSALHARVLVFGAGDGGGRAVQAMLSDAHSPYVPVALLDDDPNKANLSMRGVRVVGDRSAIAEAAEQYNATVLLVAVPTADATLIRELARSAEECGLELRLVPSVHDLLNGEVRVVDIREPNQDDLLARNRVDIDLTRASEYLTGRVVAVTGAGGSIGSELCRQVAAFKPAELIMIDRDESALHAVQMSLEGRALLDSDNLVLLDIRDRQRVARLFQDRRPDVVFHAAALKHLPLLEAHPVEALKTNVWGTNAVLEAAADANVQRFINISTDKAANPCSVLGYSKRVGEGLTAHYADATDLPYVSVRFGNVLQSRGSVLTAFRSQIAAGGPITVTDRDVTRYFMTVEEAVELVLMAGSVGHGGEVLVLEMGAQIRIDDVARRLANRCQPPIRIEYTGLRPGEKLCEELFSDCEIGLPSEHPEILYVDAPSLAPEVISNVDPSQSNDAITALLRSLCAGMAGQPADLTVVSSNGNRAVRAPTRKAG